MHIHPLIERVQPAAAAVAKHANTVKYYLAVGGVIAESVYRASNKIAQISNGVTP